MLAGPQSFKIRETTSTVRAGMTGLVVSNTLHPKQEAQIGYSAHCDQLGSAAIK